MQQDAKQLVNRLYYFGSNPSSGLLRRTGSSTQYFFRTKVEASELERPCSIDFYVGGKLTGSLVVLQQPARGSVHGSFRLNSVSEAESIQQRTVDDTVNHIQSSLEVKILKVCFVF
jgi:tyrosinase